jgi:predicted ATPase
MALVAISGSQGSGKSTIINELEALGYNTVHRKTSRSILTDWGVTLQDINNNAELTVKFQEEIIKRKWEDEFAASISSSIWFTERTYVDLAAYCTIVLGHNNNLSNFVNQYYYDCLQKNQIYSLVFYLKAGHFSIVNDGTRGANPHYSRMVDVVMEDMMSTMILPDRTVIINTPILEQRVVTIRSLAESKLIGSK